MTGSRRFECGLLRQQVQECGREPATVLCMCLDKEDTWFRGDETPEPKPGENYCEFSVITRLSTGGEFFPLVEIAVRVRGY